jgi:hypothetical protein
MIICPKCGMEEERSMDIQQVCQNCGTVLRKYEWESGMKSIFSDRPEDKKLEAICRNMVKAGMNWYDKNPNAKPLFEHNPTVFGMVWDVNSDGASLKKAILDSTDDCSGALFQEILGTVLWIRSNGWNRYVELMREARR